jgi:hypothetical protein
MKDYWDSSEKLTPQCVTDPKAQPGLQKERGGLIKKFVADYTPY